MSVDMPKTIDLNYIKTADFREITCDGIVGGPTPNSKIWVAFYTERFPLPRIVRHAIIETDVPGQVQIDQRVPAQPLDGRSGVVRNVEFGVYLTSATAVQLRDWLNEQIKNIEGT